jgi:hypothetical protein
MSVFAFAYALVNFVPMSDGLAPVAVQDLDCFSFSRRIWTPLAKMLLPVFATIECPFKPALANLPLQRRFAIQQMRWRGYDSRWAR